MRFQEPQDVEAYAKGYHITPIVDLAIIDRVPITLVLPTADTLCEFPLFEKHFTQIKSPQTYLRFEKGGHVYPAGHKSKEFIQRMVETVELGTTLGGNIRIFTTYAILSFLFV